MIDRFYHRHFTGVVIVACSFGSMFDVWLVVQIVKAVRQ